MPKRVELHCHSTYSDGTCRPSEVVDRAKKDGVDFLILTDHDSVSGGPEAVEAGRSVGMDVRVGIEINCAGQDRVHILGYGLNVKSPGFSERLTEFRRRRDVRASMMVDKLKALGFPIEYEDVKGSAHETVGRPHVADALRRKGVVKSRQEAFDRFLIKDKPGYVPPMGPEPDEAIALIKDAGGFACLAHPQTAGKEPELDALYKLGLEAIEVNYAAHGPSQIRAYAKFASERGLLALGGSDFHGPKTGRDYRMGVEYEDGEHGRFLERLSRCS